MHLGKKIAGISFEFFLNIFLLINKFWRKHFTLGKKAYKKKEKEDRCERE